ncbi:MAG: hypothetical protein WAU32_00145 [Thermoanaerobaculia bacterium]
MVGHLVNCFDTDDAFAKSRISKTFLDLVLRLAGAKNQNRLRIANRGYNVVIVPAEMACEPPISRVLCTALTPRKADVLLNARQDVPQFFSVTGNSRDNGLPMINPQGYVALQKLGLPGCG